MKRALLAVALVIAASACARGTDHVSNTAATGSTSTVGASSGAYTASIQDALTDVDRDLANVDGQLHATDGDLSSTNEGDVQQ